MEVDIRVDLSGMEASEGLFQQVLYALEAELDRLDTELRTSLSEWSGDAREAYQVAHEQWRAAADEMVKNLAWLRRVTRISHTNFQQARSVNLTMWQGNA